MKYTDRVIQIPSDLCSSLGLPNKKMVTVYIGNRSTLCRVDRVNIETQGDADSVLVSNNLAVKLGIPAGIRLNIAQVGDKLRIGPLIGVLARKKKNGAFGQDSFYRKLLLQLRKQNGLGMVFSPESIDWKRKRVRGFTLPNDGTNQWKQYWFPFPDVCYNRYFRKESDPWSYPILQRMKTSGVKSFNAPMGSKWRIHNLLSKEKELKRFLPDTQLLNEAETLKIMIQKYNQVYVKPANGCQGRGITFVRRAKGVYLCQGSQDKGERKYLEIGKIYRKIKSSSKQKKFLVQQGITSPSRTGKFDVRVMVQKESDNSWQITGIAGRVGAKGRITTNLHTGGQSAHIEQLLSRCGFAHEKVVDIITTLKETALNIAKSIEKHVNPIGEIGMDFIIDENGGIWFLEVNSKPGRRAFSSIESNGENRMTIARPMHYAQYLAGF